MVSQTSPNWAFNHNAGLLNHTQVKKDRVDLFLYKRLETERSIRVF